MLPIIPTHCPFDMYVASGAWVASDYAYTLPDVAAAVAVLLQ